MFYVNLSETFFKYRAVSALSNVSPAGCLATQRRIVVFFNIYHLPSTHNYSTTWLSILMLQSRQGLVRLVMQSMMDGIQIIHRLQVHIMFHFAGYKDDRIEAYVSKSKQASTIRE